MKMQWGLSGGAGGGAPGGHFNNLKGAKHTKDAKGAKGAKFVSSWIQPGVYGGGRRVANTPLPGARFGAFRRGVFAGNLKVEHLLHAGLDKIGEWM